MRAQPGGGGGGRGQALVRVRDNGVGIDPELLPRIFDLFTQADRSLARSAGGLGIGLSLAHRLVEMHAGTISASSQGPGKGSEFVVRLPTIPEPSPAPPEAPPPADETLTIDGDGEVRVLLVDDNVDLVTMLSSALRLKGYTVQSANTGPDGLRMAQHWRPEIVLLDIGLPGLDGYEVARRLRTDAGPEGGEAGTRTRGGSRMRLIALTGYGQDADIALAHEVGFDGHLVKPCDFDELEKMMTAVLPTM
ncbi:MAG: response regulator [Phycisphaerales bacterium]